MFLIKQKSLIMIIVDNYKELERFVDMFKNKVIDLLIVVGPEGVSKSYTIQQVMRNTKHLNINTHLTPLEAYSLMYEYNGQPIICDDIDALLKNSKIISLFKQCGETLSIKRLNWNSTQKIVEVPREFTTTSNLLIICNNLPHLDENKRALYSRGFVINFKPSKDEIKKKLISISKNKEVLEFLLKYLPNYDINLRHLIKGTAIYNYDKNLWKDILLKEINVNLESEKMNDILNSNLPNNKKVLEISRLRKCGIRNAQIILKKRRKGSQDMGGG